MFEKLFTFAKESEKEERPRRESADLETFSDFECKEKKMTREAVGFLEESAPEKFKNKAANLLLAFSLFAGASSAFAGEDDTQKEKAPEMGGEQVLRTAEDTAKKNQIADFDWGKMVGKIEVSVGAKKESIQQFTPESTGLFEVENSKFYERVNRNDVIRSFSYDYQAIATSNNFNDYLKNLSFYEQEFSEKQKILSLQHLGALLQGAYDSDMLASGQRIAISGDDIFRSLRGRYFLGEDAKTGICGNIHTFIVKVAGELGVEAFLQNGNSQTGPHVWSGIVSRDDKQIVFLDYGTLIPTGTLNYQDALGIAERYHNSVSIFNNFVANEKEVLFPVKSRAQKTIEVAMEEEGVSERLEQNLEIGEIKKREKGLGIKINQETREIKLNSDSFAISAFEFKNSSNNPYQSLENLNALRGSVNFGGEKARIETGVTVLNMNIRDLKENNIPAGVIIGNIGAEYVHKKELTKSEYGQFIASFGATVNAAMKLSLGEKKEAGFDGALGGRFIYVDPNNVGKVYIGVSEVFRAQHNNFEEQKIILKEAAKNFVVGGEVKVLEGTVVKMEAGKSNADWGKGLKVKGSVENDTLKGSVSYENKVSDYERFIPTSNKIEVGVGYKGGPMWGIDIIGAKTTEKYKDTASKNIYGAEVKLRVLFW